MVLAPCFMRVWLTSWAVRKRGFCPVFGDPSAGPEFVTAIQLATAHFGWVGRFQARLGKTREWCVDCQINIRPHP
jgi:hypothetical protein